jgi:hypothetical protein
LNRLSNGKLPVIPAPAEKELALRPPDDEYEDHDVEQRPDHQLANGNAPSAIGVASSTATVSEIHLFPFWFLFEPLLKSTGS